MQLRLRASIVLAVVVGLIIPATVSSVLTLDQRQQALVAQLQADHERLADILALGMQLPLWNLSPDAGQPLFRSVFSDRRVTSLTVRDTRFGILLQDEEPSRRTGQQTVVHRQVLHERMVIGHVSVEMDNGQLHADIARERKVFALTVLGQLLLSLFLIVVLLQVRLLAPLRLLIAESQRLARREWSTPFAWRRADELGSLGRSLESTRQALQALFEEIENKNRALEEDIVRRVQAEGELRRHREHLEELVRARTEELTIAKERAEIANRAKSTFLTSMSHELRTPLNAVLGYAQLLRREPGLSEVQIASLDTIRRSGEHLLGLINELLDLSRIEAGRFELVQAPADLHAFLHGIADIIRIRAEQKHLHFVLDLAPGQPAAVTMDARRLRQVLLNLLGNAVKFTHEGEVGLRVRQLPGDGPDRRLAFEVYDTGVGIEPDALARIFQPFEQAADIQRRFGGTGLGLSISSQLVRMMGGEIKVDSRPGNGSVFRFTVTVGPAGDAAAPADPGFDILGYEGPQKAVLIGGAAGYDALADLLVSVGFRVIEEKAADALERACRDRPDAILLRCAAGENEATLRLLRHLRAEFSLAQIPVIAVHPDAEDGVRQAWLAAGATGVLPAPVEPSALLDTLAASLGLAWIRGGARRGIARGPRESFAMPPPGPDMDMLYRLALAGNMRDIREFAAALAERDAQLRPFAMRLRDLAAACESKAIVSLVEQAMQAGQPS